MKKILVLAIFSSFFCFVEAMDKNKKDVTNLLLSMHQQKFSVYEQFCQMYKLKNSNKKDSHFIDIKKVSDTENNAKQKKRKTRNFDKDLLKMFLNLHDLKKDDSSTGALIEILGGIEQQNQQQHDNKNEQLKQIIAAQNSNKGTYIREGSGAIRDIIKIVVLIGTMIAMEVIKSYTTKTT